MAENMKAFYKKSVLFWFILLILAFINAIVREITYKPLLTPLIGIWAHQISSLTGIILFFIAIYFFLKRVKENYKRTDLIRAGLMWIFMTIIFETFMNMFVRKLSFSEVMQTYYFWEGETWIFVLMSLIISPLIIHRIIENN